MMRFYAAAGWIRGWRLHIGCGMLLGMNTNVETVFAVSITMQSLAVVTHDWVNVPGWTHGHQVQEVIGRTKLLAATAVNGIFPGLAVVLVWPYFHTAKARLIPAYWVIYPVRGRYFPHAGTIRARICSTSTFISCLF